MSGICGLYYLNNSAVNVAQLAGMVDSIAHRGPDDAGLWQKGSVGLGHRLLYNTPESKHEKLPRVHKSDRWVITADARLDNRPELIERLGLSTFWTEQVTDSELILEAYIEWGERVCDRLLGDFSFAIWDALNQHLFLGRDHFGVKPLYYYCDRHLFAFATEIKALLYLPDIPQQLNPTKVADYLTSLFEDTEITFYQNIFRLPAAHQLQATPQGLKKTNYWQLDPNKEIHLKSDKEYAEALREKFEQAVECRLRSAYPVGSMLSGGLDSSSISCVARDLLVQRNKPPLKTFSAVFDTVTECDERNYIQAVIDQGNVDPCFVMGDRISPLTDLNQMFWHQDEAFYAPNLFLHWGLYKAAKAQNVRTVLDGFDGDTTISHGLPYVTELAQNGQWLALVQEIRGFSKNFDRPLGQLLWKYLWQQGVSPRSPKLIQRSANYLYRKVSPKKAHTLKLQADFAESVGLKDRILTLRQRLNQSQQSARAAHAQRLSWGVLPLTLEVADKAAAAHSIEPRFPFFDKRLVEFCLAIPPSQKIHHGWTRMVMRQAMNNILPSQVQWRSGKSDLSPNFHHGLRHLERDRLSRVLQEDTALIEPYVDVALLRQTYQRFLTDETMPDSDVLSIWKPLTLAMWLKQMAVPSSPSQLTHNKRQQEIIS